MSDTILRSKAAVCVERRGLMPGTTLYGFGLGGSIDLMPKFRFCEELMGFRNRERGRRKGGGRGTARRLGVFGGILISAQMNAEGGKAVRSSRRSSTPDAQALKYQALASVDHIGNGRGA